MRSSVSSSTVPVTEQTLSNYLLLPSSLSSPSSISLPFFPLLLSSPSLVSLLIIRVYCQSLVNMALYQTSLWRILNSSVLKWHVPVRGSARSRWHNQIG